MSSILFKVNSNATKYSAPGFPNGTVPDEYIRASSIWLYDTSTRIAREIGENEIEDSELSPTQSKYLYAIPGNYYVIKSEATYVQNMQGNYFDAQMTNKCGALKEITNGLYGPNPNAPVKSRGIDSGTSVKWDREYGEWAFLTSPVQVWVPKSSITEQTANSNSQYINDPNSSYTIRDAIEVIESKNHNNSYSGEVIVTRPSPNPIGLIKGSKANFLTNPDIKSLIQSAGIYDRNEIEWYDKFSRFGYIDPYNPIVHTKEYVFFTKPDLHIFNNKSISAGINPEIANIPIFNDAYYRYRPVLKQLQWSVGYNNPFMNLLSNSIKSSLELPGISADEIDTSANIYGTKMTYRKGSNSSDESFDFSIEFEDTKYLEVYMLFKLYDEYQKRKIWGEISPPDQDYIINKILHDQISIYKFIVSDDGMSLIYWAKLTGCYPKSVPREAFSDVTEGSLKFSVQWRAQFVDDMDPQILTEFNSLVQNLYNSSADFPLYNNRINAIDGRWATTPYISQTQMRTPNEVNFRYQLNWRV